MPYTTPTPSTVSAGDTFPASAYNILSADLQDHESRIKTGVESYTTSVKNALTSVATGTVVYDSTLGVFQSYTGSAWVNLQGTPPSLTTAQKTALGTPATGTQVYDSTLGLMQMWNGVRWLATGGYTPLVPSSVALDYGAPTTNTNTTISWSGVRYVSIDGIFNTNLRQYRMILKTTATSSVSDTANFYFRDGSGDRTSSVTLGTSYILTRDNNNAATFSFPNQASPTIQTAIANLSSYAPNTASKFEFYDVGSATLASWEAWMIGAYTNTTPGNYLVQRGIGWDTAAAARTGLTLFCGSGQTWSGSVSFYGMA